ncbi:MAG: protein kinase, partial [Pseudomonadota bacterium]
MSMLAGLMKKKTPQEEQQVIQTIDRFQLLEKLGKGAQGVVYLAKDLELNRQVAIKTLLHRSKDSEQIFNEARNVGTLEHQNIIPLYEIGAHNDKPYLVYPYVKGVTLRDYLIKQQTLTVMEAVTLISQVLDGLSHAHDKGVIHRDLNPANILLDENDMPRIMDFGISDFAGNSTSQNDIKGTVQYMSPELLNNQPVGAWSDVFSIGVIAYEMLTKHQLFKANNSMVSIYKIINESILPPSNRNKSVDKRLESIIMKSLAKNTEQRYASAIEMKADIDAYLEVENGDVEITNVPVINDKQNAREQSTLLLLERALEKNPDFPVMGNNVNQIMELKNDKNSADKLAEIILRDQSLSGKILSLVNSASYGQFGGEINTISRAIVILGVSQIQSMSISIMVFEKLTNGPMAELLKSNACESFVSAIFARHLTKKSKSINSEEAFLASMFHNIGKQITIFYLADEYNEILNLVIEKGIDEEKACKRSLGMTFSAIGKYIAEKWQLPENIVVGIQSKPIKPTLKPSSSKEYLTQLSTLTNEIIESAALGNHARSEKKLKEIVTRYQASFNLDYEKVIQMLNYLMKELISYCELLDIDYRRNNF